MNNNHTDSMFLPPPWTAHFGLEMVIKLFRDMIKNLVQ